MPAMHIGGLAIAMPLMQKINGSRLFSCRLLERQPSDRLPAAVDEYDRGVSLSGMSKAFGMPGIRIGWLAVKDVELMRNLQRLHDYSTICSSAPSEVCEELSP